MAIDLDWLISRFDSVSEKYPGLALVGLESPKEFTSRNCEVPDSEWGMHFPVRTYEGEYGHQFYYAGDSVEHNPQGISLIKSLKPLLAFPQWTFGGMNSNVLKRGWWSIWLHRKFGFDPEASEEKQNLCSNSECLDAYQPILELATDVLIHQFYSDQEWYCEQGAIRDAKWRRSAPWLLFLLSHFRIRRESQNRHVIDDVGIASSIVLRSMRDSLLDQDTTQAPQRADNQADEDGVGYQLSGTLTENDRSILIAMLDLKAGKIQPRVSKEILGAVIIENEVGDSKRAFDNLSSLKLIESKRGPSGGYYLTEQGVAIAKDLKSRSGGIVPTN
jgi:hypothetical protein